MNKCTILDIQELHIRISGNVSDGTVISATGGIIFPYRRACTLYSTTFFLYSFVTFQLPIFLTVNLRTTMLLSGLKSELDELHKILSGLAGERINKQMYKTERRALFLSTCTTPSFFSGNLINVFWNKHCTNTI